MWQQPPVPRASLTALLSGTVVGINEPIGWRRGSLGAIYLKFEMFNFYPQFIFLFISYNGRRITLIINLLIFHKVEQFENLVTLELALKLNLR